jgi:hypothetical protein
MKNGAGKSHGSKISTEEHHFDVVIIGSTLPALTSATVIMAASLSSLCVYYANTNDSKNCGFFYTFSMGKRQEEMIDCVYLFFFSVKEIQILRVKKWWIW